MSLVRRLDHILSINDAVEQSAKFQALFDELAASFATESIKELITRSFGDDIPQTVSRDVTFYVSKNVSSLSEAAIEEICLHAIETIKNHNAPFDEADYAFREVLFDYYKNREMYRDAAEILSCTKMNSSTKEFTDAMKADIYVRCAEAFFLDDATVDAEVFVNKASGIINDVKDWRLILRYRVTFARVLDASRKFIDAAMRYYELSCTQNVEVSSEDLLELLGKAVTCAVLGKAGPQRSRVLGLLYQDERSRSLDTLPHYTAHCAVLSKMYTDQLLRKEELVAFETSLLPHQKALAGDGLTIPERAVIEHNLVAIGKIYDNIRFQELSNLLCIDESRVEKVAAKMITEERLLATIDQTENVLQFTEDSNQLLSWDDRIHNLCAEVTECVDHIIPIV